jgi:class 3 adenylate cyclase
MLRNRSERSAVWRGAARGCAPDRRAWALRKPVVAPPGGQRNTDAVEGHDVDERPNTRYAQTPDGVSIAYQVFGEGPMDLALAGGGTPIDLLWDEPGFVRCAKRLRRFSRVILREPRGVGASGGSPAALAEEITDAAVTTVLDAAGCERVVLVGADVAGTTAIRYSATHPDRVTALILVNTFAHYVREDDYPVGLAPEDLEEFTSWRSGAWGTADTIDLFAPSHTHDQEFRVRFARWQRLVASPEQNAQSLRYGFSRDVRALLPSISVPTLVLHRKDDQYVRVEAGRYVAAHIPGAKYVELPGADHLFFAGDTGPLMDEVEEFLTGHHEAPEGDVVTTTILFTDIVSSTEQAARMGHRKWTALNDDHDTMVRSTLRRYGGREIKTIGDGFLVTFDATTRAVRAGTEIVTAAKNIGLGVRAGVHIGEVEVRQDDVVGLAVSIAKRICDLAGRGQVLVSEVVNGLLVGSDIATSEQGTQVLKGVPGEWRVFAVES